MRPLHRAAGALLLAAASAAGASPLTKENEGLLCIPSPFGRVVDADRLAYLIVSQAGGGLYLDGANAAGSRDGVIQLRSSATLPSEPVYVVQRAGAAQAAAERPFGPLVDLVADDRAKKARDAVMELTASLAPLMMAGEQAAGPALTYRLRPTDAVGSLPSTADEQNPLGLFGWNPPYVIACEAGPAASSTGSGSASPKPRPDPVSARFVLRGAVKDLSIAPGDLKDASAASIGYAMDEEADTEAVKLKGVAGVRIGAASGSFEAIPFLSYENSAITGADNDIEKLAPGILIAHRHESPAFALHSKLEASFIDDLQQGSHQGKLRLYLDPAFALGRGRGVLFGSYLRPLGPLWLRPDLTVIADATRVFRAGTSEALAEADDYFGFGAELALRARLELGRPISDVALKLGVRNLAMAGEIDENHIRRWFGSLEYAPKDVPYVGVALQFSKGENDDTFQDEDSYGIGLTLRY